MFGFFSKGRVGTSSSGLSTTERGDLRSGFVDVSREYLVFTFTTNGTDSIVDRQLFDRVASLVEGLPDVICETLTPLPMLVVKSEASREAVSAWSLRVTHNIAKRENIYRVIGGLWTATLSGIGEGIYMRYAFVGNHYAALLRALTSLPAEGSWINARLAGILGPKGEPIGVGQDLFYRLGDT